jgi:adenosine deaminase
MHSMKTIGWYTLAMFFLSCVLTTQAQNVVNHRSRVSTQTATATAEKRTARHFESLRKSPSEQLAFLMALPKGGDLHNHLSGSIYAESYIQWAAENGLCVSNQTMVLSLPPCSPAQTPVSTALTNGLLYRQMIDAWSMRNWQVSGQSGHDHFFDTFGKFSAATYNQTGRMIADAASRAAHGHVSYLELMITLDGSAAMQVGQKSGWDGDPVSSLQKLRDNGIANAVAAGIKNLNDAEKEKDKLLKCGTDQADAGCSVTIRYIYQALRAIPLASAFAQYVTGFELANDPNSKVVALNLVQPEDSLLSMQNFSPEMQMLKFLRPLYPRAHLTLHAGELAPGLVTPEGLRFHVRDSVMTAHAERIGHGVDVMQENEPIELLKEMARRNVLVEICLTSNDVILGISGAQHPLSVYLKYGVPVALATDDEGVSRSEMSREFFRAANDQGLSYPQLKMLARNSLQYAFIHGSSLWQDASRFLPVSQCVSDVATTKLNSAACREYVASSEKAKLQGQLELDFKAFESRF